MANLIYKGFIKDSQGNIILPISRGELIFDVNGKIALQSELFKAIPKGTEGHPNGEYGLMGPLDLEAIKEAQEAIQAILNEIGGTGGSEGDSIRNVLSDLQDQLDALKASIGEQASTNSNTVYGYVNTTIGQQSDAAGTNTVYAYINQKFGDALTSALQYKGTVAINNSVTATIHGLPTNPENGDVYKVVEPGTYTWKTNPTDEANQQTLAKVGDVFIYVKDSKEWSLIPAGDEIWLKIGENQIIQGLVVIEGADGVSVSVNGQKITISGTVTSTALNIAKLADRVTDLETTVGKAAEGSNPATGIFEEIENLKNRDLNLNGRLTDVENTLGKDSEGTIGVEGYKPATGLVKDVRDVLKDITEAVITPKDLINDANQNKLVRAGAVAETAKNLATHIATYEAKVNEIESKYLYAKTFDLSTQFLNTVIPENEGGDGTLIYKNYLGFNTSISN